MIDCIPNSTPAMPSFSGASPTPAPAASPSASSVDDKTLPGPASGTTRQASFAEALQDRLKLIALNKTTATRAVVPAMNPTGSPSELPAQFNLPLIPQALPLDAQTPIQASAIASAEEVPSGKTSGKDIDDSTAPAPAPTDLPYPAAIPTALNVVTPLPQANLPQPQPVLASNEAPATPLPKGGPETAILAAISEKTVQPAANQELKASDLSFADVLRGGMPQASANQVAAQAVAVREIATPVASAHWASDMGNQLVWMANQRESRADLVLNPPQLGRIEVSITLNGDQATATFVSANPEVRDALQGSLPRLREVMADAGVFLGQANVGAESFKQGGNGTEKEGKSPGDSFSPVAQSLLGSTEGLRLAAAVQPTIGGRGLIDLFA